MKIRPAAVPLITVDPFFSVWSPANALYDAPTVHWTAKPCPLLVGVYINKVFYSLTALSTCDEKNIRYIEQKSLNITPTSSVYVFENESVKLTLSFITPTLLDRPDIFSRPVSYVDYRIENKCGADVRFLFGISTRAAVNYENQQVEIKKTDCSLSCGNVCQNPLADSDDQVMIDWGYLHLGDKNARVGKINGSGDIVILPTNAVYTPHTDEAYLLTVKNEESGVITLAYDEIYPIEYFGKRLREYYTKYFGSFEDMVKASVREYPEIKALCDKFDKSATEEAKKHGERYAAIVTLAYRQSVAAHKLVEDEYGNMIFLSKENNSNGCIGTLDITYPSIPLYLKYNPELVKGMLRPILRFASSDAWKFDFAPHDVGQYPLANGQVYGTDSLCLNGNYWFRGKSLLESMQMPVEEIGNMLLCLAAVKKYGNGDATLFDENRALMKKWADYLIKYGYDPENQLCTDDFAGHLAHNCNLSIKAILGIAAYGELSGEAEYTKTAKEYVRRFESEAKADHGATRLTFDNSEGWSLKYNIIWDNLLGYKLFSDELKRKEIELYKTKLNRYGVPLDSRADYTKLDWLMWSAEIFDDKEYFDSVCESITAFINETPDRVPLSDWYFTSTANYKNFRNRSVVGALFIKML